MNMRKLAPVEWLGLAVAALAIGMLSLAAAGLPWLRGIGLEDFQRILFRPAVETRTDIALVTITPETLGRLRMRDPVDGRFLAQLITRIAAHKPRIIALDLVPGETGAEADTALLQAVKAATGDGIAVLAGSAAARPSPSFAAAGWQYCDITPDLDEGLVWRRLPSGEIAEDGSARPALAHAIAEKLGEPADAGPQMAIDYVRTAGGGPLMPTFAADLSDYPDAGLRGKIVLVGYDLPFRDRYRTPLMPLLGARDGTLPGLAIQGQAVAQLLDHRTRSSLGTYPALLLCGLAAALAMLAQLTESGRARRWGVAAALLLGLWLLGGLAVRWTGVDLPLSALLLSFAFGTLLCRLYVGRRFRDARAVAVDALHGQIGDSARQRILTEVGAVSLAGSVRDLIVLRCEIQQFDALAVSLPAEQLVATIARLQQILTSLAWEHGGTIVNHHSTGMAVLFGAPLSVPKPGEQALSCGLAMVRETAVIAEREQQETTAPRLAIQVALHAGPMIVGDFCGEPKSLYDAVGPTLAMAERLLDLGPVLDAPLLASYDAAGRVLGTTFRPIGSFELPDGQGVLEVFIPLDRQQAKGPVALSYFKGIEALRSGDREAARQAFLSALEADPSDGPARFHVLRLESGGSGMRLAWPITG